jgi:hypothetical protein
MGIKTFIVNQNGVVYGDKDLGPRTGSVTEAMTKLDQGPSWELSP